MKEKHENIEQGGPGSSLGGVEGKQGSWALRNEPGRFMGMWVEPDPGDI